MVRSVIPSCADWYVLHTKVGSELYIKELINKIVDLRLMVPSRELAHKKKGKIVKIIKPLFPGYIFLFKDIQIFNEKILQKKVINHYLRPICHTIKKMNKLVKTPARVKLKEMQLINLMINNKEIIPISKISYTVGNHVNIIDGPLKRFKGQIKFINWKKQKAVISIKLFNRETRVSLGIKVIE